MECLYTIVGVEGKKTYSELLNYIDDLIAGNELDLNRLEISDIVFSKTVRRDAQSRKVEDVRAKYKEETSFKVSPNITPESNLSLILNGEPQIDESSKRLSILSFFDTELFQHLTSLNIDDYKDTKIKKLTTSETNRMSEEEAQKLVDDEIKFWEQIQKDAIILHKLFTSPSTRNTSKTFSDFKNENKDILPDYLKNNDVLCEKFYNQLKNTYKYIKTKHQNSITHTNLNLISKINDLDIDLIGHIDYLIIGEDGVAHLYLYKTTSESPHQWDVNKRKKYLHQLSFLKAMLSNNGINVDNMTLNIIPVQMKYSESHDTIESILVHKIEEKSTRFDSLKYNLNSYDAIARRYISPSTDTPIVYESTIQRGKDVAAAIFTDLNIKEIGIKKSAKWWIANAPNADLHKTYSLVIKQIGDQDHFYDVIINGKVYPIKSKIEKTKNPEILELVENHLDELSDNIGYSVQRLAEEIKNKYKSGYSNFNSSVAFRNISHKLNSLFYKYISANRDEENNIIGYDWELIEELIDAGIIAFKHKSGVIDFFTLSPFNLNVKVNFSKGSNILGCHRRNDQYIDLEANWGNIEVVRALSIINELLPKMSGVKLGTINVIGTTDNASHIRYNIANFNQNYYQKIIEVVNSENSEIKITNNFTEIDFIDDVEYLIEEYLKITKGKSEEEIQDQFDRFGLEAIKELEGLSRHERAESILNMMSLIEKSHKDLIGKFESYLSVTDTNVKRILRLYDLLGKAYFYTTGTQITRRTQFDPIDKMLIIPTHQEDPNMKYVSNLLQVTYDNIASEFEKIYNESVRNIFDEFYSEINYTQAQNMWAGNQAQQFSNFYEIDPRTGKKTMNFKNPYDMSNDLTLPERKLLKKVLFSIHKITNPTFSIGISEEQKLANYVQDNPSYLWVPLERASKSTSRQSVNAIKARFKNAFRKLKKIEQRFDEYVNDVLPEERELLGNQSDEFYTFSVRNPFETNMPINSKTEARAYSDRHKMLEQYEPEFFETNIENILIDYIVKKIQTHQLQKFMTISKAFLLQLHLTGNMSNNQAVIDKEIKQIEDYIKINVFNTSIMGKSEQSIISAITPVKKFATDLLLGANVVGFVRDITQGVLENITRTAIKFNTDIDSKNITKAYWYVTQHATSNAMAANLLSKLCLKYRLSNTDVARIAERAKTQRNGIFSYDNMMYGTLRTPDFINRMVLFVARCMQDGTWEAFSLDKDNNLHYDWTRDERFSIYAQNLKNHKDYEKQKARYFSQIRNYNLDHPEHKIDVTDNLPEAYTNIEVRNIRMLADNIYGAYDKSKKAMLEFHSLGITFAMFTTWMQGHVNNYLMKTQKNESRLLEVQDTDEFGRLLYFDENGGITTNETNRPVMKHVPIIIEGIVYTIGRLSKACYKDGIQGMKDFLDGNIVAQQNLRKLFSDLAIGLLLALLFKSLSVEYKEYKKEAEKNPVVQNLITEILYKGTSKSYDTFLGLYNLVGFIGDNRATPIYSVPVELFKNVINNITGDKSFDTLLLNNTGFGRSFKDTYNIYKNS